MAAAHEPPTRKLTALLAVVSDVGIALAFLLSWIDPASTGIAGDLLVLALVQVVINFGMVFVVFGVRVKGWRWVTRFMDEGPLARAVEAVLLTSFFLLFVVVLSASAGTWWPLLAFARVVLVGALFPPRDAAGKAYLHLRGIYMGVALLLGLLVAGLLPLPVLGAHPDVVQAPGGIQMEGSAPHRELFFGLLYFGGSAAYETWLALRVPPERAVAISKRAGADKGPLDEPS